MAYVYLFGATVCSALLSIMGSLFNRKNAAYKNFSMLYNFILIAAACLGWGVIYLTDFSFDARVLPYSLGYAAGYAMALISLFKALECGPVSLTALLKSISMISVSIWGFIFWDASPTPYVLTGLALVLVSLVLCFAQKRKEKAGGTPFKWYIYTALLFIGNGGSLIVQKYQQIAFGGAHKNMLMFFATATAAIACLVFFQKADINLGVTQIRGSFHPGNGDHGAADPGVFDGAQIFGQRFLDLFVDSVDSIGCHYS